MYPPINEICISWLLETSLTFWFVWNSWIFVKCQPKFCRAIISHPACYSNTYHFFVSTSFLSFISSSFLSRVLWIEFTWHKTSGHSLVPQNTVSTWTSPFTTELVFWGESLPEWRWRCPSDWLPFRTPSQTGQTRWGKCPWTEPNWGSRTQSAHVWEPGCE